jgi:timeless
LLIPGLLLTVRSQLDYLIFFQEWDNREEEDTLLIERILLLIRNILHVPADPKAEKV